MKKSAKRLVGPFTDELRARLAANPATAWAADGAPDVIHGIGELKVRAGYWARIVEDEERFPADIDLAKRVAIEAEAVRQLVRTHIEASHGAAQLQALPVFRDEAAAEDLEGFKYSRWLGAFEHADHVERFFAELWRLTHDPRWERTLDDLAARPDLPRDDGIARAWFGLVMVHERLHGRQGPNFWEVLGRGRAAGERS